VPPAPAAAIPAEATMLALRMEVALLQEKLKALQECSVTPVDLAAKNCRRLKEVAAEVRAQRHELTGFEGYVRWMSGNVAGYSKYLSAGSVAAGFAKVLPIPYAGQASVFTKFVSNAAVSLSSASVTINKYLATSQRFLARTDALDPDKGVNAQEVSELVRFADQDLLEGMTEVQERLVSTSELTSSSLSFLESLNHYVGSTDEYWSKTKSFLRSGTTKRRRAFSLRALLHLRTGRRCLTASSKCSTRRSRRPPPRSSRW